MKRILILLFIPFLGHAQPAADPICQASSANSALVVIDMQPFYVKRGVNVDSAKNKAKLKKLLQAQVEAIQTAKKAGIPIIVFEAPKEAVLALHGTEEDAATARPLTEAIGDYPSQKHFIKNANGIFFDYNQDAAAFKDYLRAKKIGNLIVTGANGAACVAQSIRGALQNNCNVVAYSKGIADFNYPENIYPFTYPGDYSGSALKAVCSNCSFKQTANLNEIRSAMKFFGTQTTLGVQEDSSAAH